MFSLHRKTKRLLGIDISSTSVKLLELSQTVASGAELYRIEAFAIEPLPPSAVIEKKIADVDAIGQGIQRAVARAGTKVKRAAVALPGSAVITKTIALSAALSDAEMEAQIQLEADQYIPYPLEEVNIDFDLLGPSSNNPDMVDVLLAASRRENVDDRVAALELAGLAAAIVDVQAYAMEKACTLLLGLVDDHRPEQTVAVADVGASTTTLHVLRDGKIVYSREQNFGGNQLLDEIQYRYGIPRPEAFEHLVANTLPGNVHHEVIGPFKEALAQQITRALQFFYSAGNVQRIDQMILAGGAAAIADIDRSTEGRLGFPVSIANPFARMGLVVGINAATVARAAPSMMIATGLALRAFD
jgi:type IV pilus assembly protein PilM